MGLLLMELEMFLLEGGGEDSQGPLIVSKNGNGFMYKYLCGSRDKQVWGSLPQNMYIPTTRTALIFMHSPPYKLSPSHPPSHLVPPMNLQRRRYHPHLEVRTQDPEKVNNPSEASLQMASVNIRTQVSVQLPLFCAALQNWVKGKHFTWEVSSPDCLWNPITKTVAYFKQQRGWCLGTTVNHALGSLL